VANDKQKDYFEWRDLPAWDAEGSLVKLHHERVGLHERSEALGIAARFEVAEG
jgi:hypothetical protein